MIPAEALIISSGTPSSRWKLFGQSLLERNIRMLRQAGAERIYLDLNEEDLHFYKTEVKKHIDALSGIEISYGKIQSKKYIQISSNQFILFSSFSRFETYFKKDKEKYSPLKRDDQYIIESDTDFIKARKFAIETIRTGSGGKLAQNINKRISIPLSLVLSNLRIRPNTITILNFFLGVLSIVLLLSDRLIYQASGGILVQICSIVDGCDGEVARMTTRFSKLGGMLDTVSDQLLAAALITVALVKVYINYPAEIFFATMFLVLFGVFTMAAAGIYYVRRYSESMSLASYNREFLEVLPRTDLVARSMLYLQYLGRKEFYSFFVFVFCLFGALQVYMLVFSVLATLGGFIMLYLAMRYYPGLTRIRK